MTASLFLDPVDWALVLARLEAGGPCVYGLGNLNLSCPNDCERFGGKVPGYTRGSNWDWVPCGVCDGSGRLTPTSGPTVIGTTDRIETRHVGTLTFKAGDPSNVRLSATGTPITPSSIVAYAEGLEILPVVDRASIAHLSDAELPKRHVWKHSFFKHPIDPTWYPNNRIENT